MWLYNIFVSSIVFDGQEKNSSIVKLWIASIERSLSAERDFNISERGVLLIVGGGGKSSGSWTALSRRKENWRKESARCCKGDCEFNSGRRLVYLLI
jgi:hypothetical protein